MLDVKAAGKISYNIMKISIAVPSYNHEKYIYDCLKSIQDQDYDNYEVLISDGGSTDQSLTIIKDFCVTDNRFTLASVGDDGQADAIMKSFSVATGEIFCFLNSDDVYLNKDVFNDVATSFLDNKDADIISFSGCYIDSNGKYIKQINLRYHPLDSTANMKHRTAVTQPATFWKREVYLSIPINIEYHFVFEFPATFQMIKNEVITCFCCVFFDFKRSSVNCLAIYEPLCLPTSFSIGLFDSINSEVF